MIIKIVKKKHVCLPNREVQSDSKGKYVLDEEEIGKGTLWQCDYCEKLWIWKRGGYGLEWMRYRWFHRLMGYSRPIATYP